MKKGLSKILSLACVFALLLTMMVPALATDPDGSSEDEAITATAAADYTETKDNLVSGGIDALSDALEIKKMNDAGTDTENVVSTLTLQGGTATPKKWYTIEDVKSMGVFVKFDNGDSVKFCPIEITATVVDASKQATLVAKTDENDKIVLGAPLTGTQYIGDAKYIFDEYGYLQFGDETTGEYVEKDKFGDDVVYFIGMNTDGTHKALKDLKATPVDAKVETIAEGTLTFVKGVFYKADASGRSVPVEGKVEVNAKNATPPINSSKLDGTAFGIATAAKTFYQTKGEDGKFAPKAGLVKEADTTNDNGNTVTGDTALYEMKVIEVTEGGKQVKYPVAEAVDLSGVADGFKNIKTTYDASKKEASGATDFYVKDHKAQLLGDEGKYPVLTLADGRYVLSADGSKMTNDVAEEWEVATTNASKKLYDPAKVLGGDNIYKIGGKKIDVYKDVEVEIDGVTMRYCLNAADKLVASNFRRRVAEDGTDLGVSYYNADGITYAGWIMQENKGASTKTLRYQTVTDGVYYIVTGLQFIPEGFDPADTTKAIAEGYYLFGKDGKQVTDTAVEMYGHKFKLNKDTHIVETIDGEAPTLADIGE